jgi:hypothetical protein
MLGSSIPRHPGGAFAALLAASLLAFGLRPAHADEEVDYDVAPGCPDRAAFLSDVARRVPGQVSGHSSGSLLNARLKVEVSATPDGFQGVLRREDASGASEPRVLRAARCEDLVQGLALTAALSFVSTSEAPPAVVAARPAEAPTPAASAAERTRPFVGLGVLIGGFVADAPMGGLELTAGLTRPASGSRAWFDLGVDGRIRAAFGRSDLLGSSATARFELYAGGVELCPLHAGFGDRGRVSLCGTGEAGLLRGRGIAIANPRWANATWLTAGGNATVRLRLAGRWQLLGSAGLERPIRRTEFVFAEPRVLVARTPAWVSAGSLAVVAHFP